MLTAIRNMSKSPIGRIAAGLIGVGLLAAFAVSYVGDMQIGSVVMSSSTLVKVGSAEVTDRDMQSAMQHRLQQVREQNPEADYATIAGDFDPLLDELIDQRAVDAFAKNHGFLLSKRLIDGEISNIPGLRGINGQVSQAAYQQFLSRQQMTDAEVRQIIAESLLQRLLITPAANGARVPLGIATPYASMLLEARQGEFALVPFAQFAAGLNPTDAQIQQFYQANQSHYMVPEQRVLKIAEVGPDQVAAQAKPTDQEIAQYYNAHQDVYGTKDIRVISQAVVPSQTMANQIAAAAKSGKSFVDAVKPAGLSAADISVGPQTQSEFADLASAKVAAAAFAAPSGAVVGPIQSPLGWHVVKIDSIQTKPGKTLAQAHDEIAAQLATEKSKTALSDLADKIQDSLDGGSNLDQAAKAAGVPVTTTPLITATGTARSDPSYKFPADLAPVLKSGFDLEANEEPVIEQLADGKGFAVVAPAQIVPEAAAPLASIRDQVKTDWINQQAATRAKAVAAQIAARANGNVSLADAIKQANASLPPVQTVNARRIQLSQMGDKVPPALAMMFTMGQGRSKPVADNQGRGIFVVKVDKITPGNALNAPALIGQVQKEFEDPVSQELAQELQAAIRADVKVKRNEAAIQSARASMTKGG